MGAIRVLVLGEGISSHRFPAPADLLAGRGGNIGLPPRHAERRQSVSSAPGGEESRPYPCSRLPGRLLTDVRGSPAAAERVPSERGAAHNLAGTALRLRYAL